jgi:type IV pilus assembly protein PilY1
MTGSPAFANLRSALVPLGMTQTGSGSSAVRTVDCVGGTAQCNSTSGWLVDLPDPGERVNVDMQLALGTLVVPSNVPQSSACTIGGYSWLNYLSYTTGRAVVSQGTATVSLNATPAAQALTVGVTVVQLPDGTLRAILVTSDAAIRSYPIPYDTPPPKGKRISWREVTR